MFSLIPCGSRSWRTGRLRLISRTRSIKTSRARHLRRSKLVSSAVSSWQRRDGTDLGDHALGQFEQSYELTQSLYEGLNDHQRRKTAHWATAAAWHMVGADSLRADVQGDYESMSDYLAFHAKGTSKSLYKAIIDVHDGQYASAFHHINKAQTLSYDELQTQFNPGPQLALKTLAKTELLVELQEVIQYKSQPELRDHIAQVWRARFKRSQDDVNTWLKRLQVWTLACEPELDPLRACYIDAAKLCVAQGMDHAAERLLQRVTPSTAPAVSLISRSSLRTSRSVLRARAASSSTQICGFRRSVDRCV